MNRDRKKSVKLNMVNLIRRNPLLVVLITCCLLGGLFARYAKKTETDPGQITSGHFYFTADILGDTRMVAADGTSSDSYAFGEKSTESTWYLYGGSRHTIDIQVQNFYDKLRITKENTTFSAKVSAVDADGKTVAATGLKLKDAADIRSDSSITLNGGAQNSKKLSLVIPTNSEWKYDENTVVKVEITSTAPYKKTLTLNFVLYAKEAALRYQVKDSVGSPYAELIIMTNIESNGSTEEGVQPYIKWPETLSVDNTNELTFSYTDGTFTQQKGMDERNMQISEPFATGRSESVYFFKSSPSENYTKQETVVNPTPDGKYTINLTE